MKNIIVAYPNKNTAMQIRNVLEKNELYVSHICATGASVLGIASDMRNGVIVTAEFLRDMAAAALAERLPAGFDVVALSKKGMSDYMSNFINMPLPLNKDEFISTIQVLAYSDTSFTNRKKDESEYISNAKTILMRVNGITEMQAHKYLQKESMHQGRKIADIARDIIEDFS